MLAKILIDVPDMYRYLNDYHLSFASIIEELDLERKPQVPIIVISLYRTEKRDALPPM
ncbi:hypothetical protein [Nitrososphaeria virus YSH_462411]|uniref:Uncharacterized protein n=1 Tax=Nitrososphaeria virus YSH_462411 TaxID=3071321 RepID=A0A976UAF9_9CAUD|nr:hypothetical protein QKV92_gp22 [Yangshan Harbor Nitrososphaeria virus]UVF62294.1 hypothetical protein [Nitrososphaeria virus YSH_462411]